MAKQIHPTEDNVIVEPAKKEEMTASGIIIPDTASQERPQEGTVIAVGPGKMTDAGNRLPMEVKVGDTVLFSKYGPTEVKLDGKELYILEQKSILAVIK